MINVNAQPEPAAPRGEPPADESGLWLPPRRMATYHRARALGGALFALIFAGWLWLQWTNVPMRYLAIGLLLVTAWVTMTSITRDRARQAQRQLAVERNALRITTAEGETRVGLADIARARWSDGPAPQAGLWLLGPDDRALAHLDLNFFADESEARAFLGWARRRTTLPFEVHWPTEDQA